MIHIFATHTHDSVLPLTDGMVRKHLKRVLALTGLQIMGIHFTHLGGLVPPGHITMGFIWKL